MPVIDFTTILIAAGLFFGLVIGDATLFGNPLRIQISVPTKLADTGFTEKVAERLFLSEAARVERVLSIVDTPGVEVSLHGSVLAAVAKALSLEQVVVALQKRVGVGVTSIEAAVLDKAGGGLEMVIFITKPDEAPAKIKLAQPDGNAVALFEHGSLAVLEEVSPYRVALTAFTHALGSDRAPPSEAKKVASAATARPWVAAHATERVMLHNLLGLIALFDSDFAGAEAQFDLTDAIQQAAPAARGTVAINRAFVAVAQKRPAEALAYYNTALEESAHVALPGYDAKIDTLAGLVAWSRGDIPRAEKLFRLASELLPDDEAPHFYLAKLLAAKGDDAGAAAERSAAVISHRFAVEVPALAQSEFWVDPVNGGLSGAADRGRGCARWSLD
jgi:tetratricopeptide (TPR) repeat protein